MVDGLSRWGVAAPQRLLFFHGIELVPWLFPAGVYVTAKALPEGFSRFPWASHALRGRSAASAAGPLQFFSWLSPVATGPNAAGRVSRLREHRAHARPGLDAGALRHYIATPFQGESQESRGTGAGRARRGAPSKEAQGGPEGRKQDRRKVAKQPYRKERQRSEKPNGGGGRTTARHKLYGGNGSHLVIFLVFIY